MNALQKYLMGLPLDQRAVMDRLQGIGVISDNCVMPASVDRDDAARAVEWLKKNPNENRHSEEN